MMMGGGVHGDGLRERTTQKRGGDGGKKNKGMDIPLGERTTQKRGRGWGEKE